VIEFKEKLTVNRLIKRRRLMNDMVLTKDEVEEVYIELREGTPMKSIAEMFGVSSATIYNLNCGTHYQVRGMRYPIVDRHKKYGKEPSINDPFWDTYWPEPMLYWPSRRVNYE
jgi:hypothetical protein